jgi:predicted metal-binding membrane protein
VVGLTRARAAPELDARRLGLLGALVVLAAVGWVVVDQRMEGMGGGPGVDLGGVGFYLSVWVVMMAAMMFPSVAPAVMTYDALSEGRRRRGETIPKGATATFVGGYLLAWTTAGLSAYALLEAIRSVNIDALAWDRAGRYVAGGVILAAAAYQLTPLKNACLNRCRGPLMFLLERWRGGRIGALRLGAEHGAWCIGCCWALMAALFALGVMSVGWMAFVAALIAGEKLLPWRTWANLGVAGLLIVVGLAVLIAPEHVPGLTPSMGGM